MIIDGCTHSNNCLPFLKQVEETAEQIADMSLESSDQSESSLPANAGKSDHDTTGAQEKEDKDAAEEGL